MLDMHRKGRWRSGNSGSHLKLTKDDAERIRADNRSQSKIAYDWGVSRSLVSNIKNNRIWN